MVGGQVGILGNHASASLLRNKIGIDHVQILGHLGSLEEIVRVLVMSRGSVPGCPPAQMERMYMYIIFVDIQTKNSSIKARLVSEFMVHA